MLQFFITRGHYAINGPICCWMCSGTIIGLMIG